MRQRSGRRDPDGRTAASFIAVSIAAALLFGACSTGSSPGGNAIAAVDEVTVAPRATSVAEITTTVLAPLPESEATTAPERDPDPATTSVAIAGPAREPAPPTVPPTVSAPIGLGDLRLSLPITELECRGEFLTIVGSAVDPARYPYVVSELLTSHPGSSYARTEYACASLLPRTPNGDAVYVVFYGPFKTVLQACSARARVAADAYVKVLYDASPDDSRVGC